MEKVKWTIEKLHMKEKEENTRLEKVIRCVRIKKFFLVGGDKGLVKFAVTIYVNPILFQLMIRMKQIFFAWFFFHVDIYQLCKFQFFFEGVIFEGNRTCFF